VIYPQFQTRVFTRDCRQIISGDMAAHRTSNWDGTGARSDELVGHEIQPIRKITDLNLQVWRLKKGGRLDREYF
jgi:hypothetical protein